MTHDHAYDPPPPLPLRSAVIGGLIAFVAIVGLMLLIRPAIFSLAPPRGDGNLGVASAAELVAGPVTRPILLTASRGLLGERDEGGHVAITVIVAQLPGSQVSVVNAWSTVNPCAVTVAADAESLVDCDGGTWSLDGEPLDGGPQPSLQRFAAALTNGAVVADFTRPVSGPGADS
ncbi:MAG: hypothetical protein ABI622_04315 [Chloroflexota bacterium]